MPLFEMMQPDDAVQTVSTLFHFIYHLVIDQQAMQVDQQVKQIRSENGASDDGYELSQDGDAMLDDDEDDYEGDVAGESSTKDLCLQMNRWMEQKQPELDFKVDFNSDSYLSSDSGLYEHESDVSGADAAEKSASGRPLM